RSEITRASLVCVIGLDERFLFHHTAQIGLQNTRHNSSNRALGPTLHCRSRDHTLEEAMELVMGFHHVPIASAMRRWDEQAESDMGSTPAARCLDILRYVRRETRKEHRVELVNVNSVTNCRCRNDVAQAGPQLGKRFARLDPAFGLLHHLLDL